MRPDGRMMDVWVWLAIVLFYVMGQIAAWRPR